jgi:hypothetical protein
LIRYSIEAKVRYLTVYNAQKGNPITDENAKKIKEAVLRLTGVPYDSSFVLIQEPAANQLPVIPVRKLPYKPSHLVTAGVGYKTTMGMGQVRIISD